MDPTAAMQKRRSDFISASGPMRNKALCDEQGFTLMETVVSLSLLFLFLVSFAVMMDGTIKATAVQKTKSTAVNLASKEIERLRNMNFNEVGSQADRTVTVDVAGTTYTIRIRSSWVDDAFDGLGSADPIPADFRRMTVTVSYRLLGKDRSVELVTNSSRRDEETETSRGNIRVTVVNSSGDPVQDVHIVVDGPFSDPPPDYTNELGEVLFPTLQPSVSPNDYKVRGDKTGYIDPNGNSIASSSATVNIDQTAPVVLVMDLPSTLVLRLVDASEDLIGKHSDIDLSNAAISYLRSFTSNDGAFTISNMFPGNYELNADAAAYDPLPAPIPLFIPPGQTASFDINMEPTPPANVQMTVTSSVTGLPIDGALITFTNNAATSDVTTGTTNISGIAQIQLQSGTYTRVVTTAGYQPNTNPSATVTAPGNYFVSVVMNP